MKVTSEKSGLFTMIPSSLARVDMVAHGRCPMRARGSVRVRIRTVGPFGFGDIVALCSRLRYRYANVLAVELGVETIVANCSDLYYYITL